LWNQGLVEQFASAGSTSSEIKKVVHAASPAELSAESTELKSFLLGPLGGTILGSYVLCAFVVAGPFKRREPWAWWAVTLSLLSWFFLDSSVSMAHGAWFNVYLINCVTLIGQGLPLMMTFRFFVKPNEPT
jgi:hypothetical protein